MSEVQGEMIMAVIRAGYLCERHAQYPSTQLLPNPLYIVHSVCVRFVQLGPSSASNLSTVVDTSYHLPRSTTIQYDPSDLHTSRVPNLVNLSLLSVSSASGLSDPETSTTV